MRRVLGNQKGQKLKFLISDGKSMVVVINNHSQNIITFMKWSEFSFYFRITVRICRVHAKKSKLKLRKIFGIVHR